MLSSLQYKLLFKGIPCWSMITFCIQISIYSRAYLRKPNGHRRITDAVCVWYSISKSEFFGRFLCGQVELNNIWNSTGIHSSTRNGRFREPQLLISIDNLDYFGHLFLNVFLLSGMSEHELNIHSAFILGCWLKGKHGWHGSLPTL